MRNLPTFYEKPANFQINSSKDIFQNLCIAFTFPFLRCFHLYPPRVEFMVKNV